MPIFAYLAILIISAIMAARNAPKPPKAEAGQLDVPLAEEGREIAVAFGTNISKSSNVSWYGDASTTPIMSSGGKK